MTVYDFHSFYKRQDGWLTKLKATSTKSLLKEDSLVSKDITNLVMDMTAYKRLFSRKKYYTHGNELRLKVNKNDNLLL